MCPSFKIDRVVPWLKPAAAAMEQHCSTLILHFHAQMVQGMQRHKGVFAAQRVGDAAWSIGEGRGDEGSVGITLEPGTGMDTSDRVDLVSMVSMVCLSSRQHGGGGMERGNPAMASHSPRYPPKSTLHPSTIKQTGRGSCSPTALKTVAVGGQPAASPVSVFTPDPPRANRPNNNRGGNGRFTLMGLRIRHPCWSG
jgi:hypothetical protein